MLTQEQIKNLKPACSSWLPPNSTSIPSNSQSSTVNKDIKIGETYNLRIQVLGKSEDFITARPIPPNGEYATTGLLEILHKYAPSFSPLPSEHGTSVPTTKHDPCRLFKKGDKVRPVKRRGRYYSSTDEKYADLVLTVHTDEVTDSRQSEIWVEVETEDDKVCWNTDPVYLELVTPVEELEPYKVVYARDYYSVEDKKLDIVASFNCKLHPNAKAAAEAERDRLNEEWRKEQK